ncbi:MAG: hypothetical protein EWM72_00282 [Nitrospira sp.]|nr:MAG: hypothetical protein EWM72_00282 [Nitrospira sp.]
MGEGGADFFVNSVVLLTEEGAPFRMTKDDVAATEISKHRRGDFSRIGPVIFPEQILCPELNRGRRAERSADRFQRGEGGSDDEFN